MVPFMRPTALAEDASPTLPVVLHALDMMESGGERFDAVCILQPTSPLRRSADIDNCIALMEKTGADSVVSVLPVPKTYNPNWVYWMDRDGKIALSTGDKEPIPRRQDLPLSFHRDGSVYVTRVTTLKSERSLYGNRVFGYEIPSEFSSNLDTHEDWQAMEMKLCGQTVPAAGKARTTTD